MLKPKCSRKHVRYPFASYQQKVYTTILVVAEMIPDWVLDEDEQWQMICDTAVTSSGE